MRLASWAIFGSVLINLAFGLVVTGAVHAARPAVATALAQCTHRSPSAPRRPVSAHFLAAVRMGWAIG
ncbi:MAG TPA: hypothetical protein VEU78_04105 [Steroidobacteraceae bacterium]|nr:hypothetical protein [Steroidobacteraceae bacterium]